MICGIGTWRIGCDVLEGNSPVSREKRALCCWTKRLPLAEWKEPGVCLGFSGQYGVVPVRSETRKEMLQWCKDEERTPWLLARPTVHPVPRGEESCDVVRLAGVSTVCKFAGICGKRLSGQWVRQHSPEDLRLGSRRVIHSLQYNYWSARKLFLIADLYR